MDEPMTPEHAQALERLRAGWGRMDGRSVLVTGATRGIGLETAVRLAGLGADVLVHGRDAGRGAAALAAVRAASAPGARPALYLADLGSLAGVRRLAAEVTRDRPRLDVLVANAGVYAPERRETADGLELTFAVNVVAPILLAAALLPALRAAGRGAHRHPELGLALDRRDLLGRPAARRPGRLRRAPRLRPVQAGRPHADARARAAARGQRRHGRLPRPGRRGHRDAGERVARPPGHPRRGRRRDQRVPGVGAGRRRRLRRLLRGRRRRHAAGRRPSTSPRRSACGPRSRPSPARSPSPSARGSAPRRVAPGISDTGQHEARSRGDGPRVEDER